MRFREIKAREVEDLVRKLCIKANIVLRSDVLKALEAACKKENIRQAKKMLGVLLENAEVARGENLALCQDTGMAAVFVEIGEHVILRQGGLIEAITRGVKKAYREGNFRKSVVMDPIIRKNTGTNTPAIIHTDIVKGARINISVMPKGFGSENKSRIIMLNPTSPPGKIVDFCVETVKLAGPDACPPYVLGVGIGGTMEHCAYLAKKALLRNISKAHRAKHIAALEREIKEKSNALKIGVMGLGGRTTVLGVNIEKAPTHIAGLPVAVNVCCHALRSAEGKI